MFLNPSQYRHDVIPQDIISVLISNWYYYDLRGQDHNEWFVLEKGVLRTFEIQAIHPPFITKTIYLIENSCPVTDSHGNQFNFQRVPASNFCQLL